MNMHVAYTPRLWSYLQLVRPPNVVTALTDILAGFAATGLVAHSIQLTAAPLTNLGWLLIATVGLYTGGVVFNDVFDAEQDRFERPERPIPSGRIWHDRAALFGVVLLLGGILAATQVSSFSAGMAMTLALTALIYDAYGKHLPILGPLNMGLCRGLNLLLGMSALPTALIKLWFIALIPIVYIAAVTSVSRGEVHGGNRRAGVVALLLIMTASIGVFTLVWLQSFHLLFASPFLLLLLWRIVPPYVRAARDPRADCVRVAVQAGVVNLIVLNASIAAGFAGLWYGLMVLLLLPISAGLARLFAVT
jgi:4-hydroxybenzoate polyprenyltransferase